ncbi:hypothetical protein [Nocardia amamiensis]|uniref:hypothetical protein n=1 Tax=Nocardia amamiensis TaxID=404578 RepID=UPI000832F7E9|nr:hypothetical protein [Nocardia amamiensis]
MEDPWSEEEYVELLEQERRRYAWVLQRYLGKTPAEAEADALKFYVYEKPGTEYRGIVFHDEAWHWAMLGLSNRYWTTHPELASPCDEYFDVE